MIRYARAPSPAMQELLLPGGFLAPLVAPRRAASVALDVHLRERDHVNVYCGLTRLLDVSLVRGLIRAEAHATYAKQPCARELLRSWKLDETGFDAALSSYFEGVTVGPRWVDGEGAVQVAWAAIREPWIPFDREAVLGYEDAELRVAGRSAERVAAARAEVEALRVANGWAPLPPEKVGAELDQLAVDRDGRLVLIELKDAAASPAAVFYAPLQLLRYVHEWSAAYESVRDALDGLRAARIAVGLSPPSTPRLTSGLRPVIGFGGDTRSREVRSRFASVLAIVNRYLPASTLPIEAWVLTDGTLQRVA